MNNILKASYFYNYLAECLRILYLIYFKPYSFERWLRDIHPKLKPTDNPFDKKAEFHTNPRLGRYAVQVCCLITVVPLLVVLLVGEIYTRISGETFNWFLVYLFFLGRLIYTLINIIIATFYILFNREKLGFIRGCLSLFIIILFIIIFMTDFYFNWVKQWSLYIFKYLFKYIIKDMSFREVSSLYFILSFGMIATPTIHYFSCSIIVGLVLGFAGDLVQNILDVRTLISLLGEQKHLTALIMLSKLLIILGLRIHLWLAELLWTFILFFISRFQKSRNYLYYLPQRFDEKIILPLPFVCRMIIEAYPDNPVTSREIIDYLISSTNQQEVAALAIYGISRDSLNRCQMLDDIVDIANQLTWIPSPPPKELGSVLPQFLDISQSVWASQEATTPYRRYELLNPPISALQELKNRLTFEKNPSVATQFGSIAERWLTILHTAQLTLEETAKQSQEIIQVYIAGNSLDPKTAKHRFKGRIDIFREIETLTLSEQPPVLLLYGGRRTGKTSALKYLPYRIGSDIIPLLVDLQGTASATTLKGFAENLAQQIIETARRLPRKIDLPAPHPDRLAEDPFPALQTWLAEIERSYSGKRFLLCLDEFERLSEVVAATNSFAPLNFIRHLLQHQKQWILLFSGSHQLSELDAYWSDYLINTRALRMTYLQESEARELILQPVEDFANIYHQDAVDQIIQITRCQPYLVQLVCYELVELLNRDIRTKTRQPDTAKATLEDVQQIIPIVLERGDQYFRELWTSLEESDRNLLRRVLQNQTPTLQDKGIVRKLARKDILNQEGNAFQVPLVQKFVEQLIEEEHF